MERDDLQRLWAAEADRTAAMTVVDRRLLQSLVLERGLARVRVNAWIQLVFDAIAPVLLGAFAYDHVAEARFLVPALFLMIPAILILHVRIRSLVDARSMDYGESVVAFQKRIESIAVREALTTRAIFVLCTLAWTPLLIVVAKAAGFDAYALGPAFMVANLAFGVVVAMTIGALFRRFGNGPAARLLDGTSAREARAALAAIEAFESDDR